MLPAAATKVPVAEPARMILAEGTVSSGLLLASVITLHPEGTGPVKVIVQVLVKPASKLAGLQLTDDTLSTGARLIVAGVELPLYAAVTVAVRLPLNAPVVTLKFLVVVPAATVTDAGTVNAA
jgi:hypothetical protein